MRRAYAFTCLLVVACGDRVVPEASSATAGSTTVASTTGPDPTTTSVVTTTGDASSTGGGLRCPAACMVDGDCVVDGEDIGATCERGRCSVAPGACGETETCWARLSGWTIPCSVQADCPLKKVCVDVGDGVGRCADVPIDILVCMHLDKEDATLPAIEGDGKLLVCVDKHSICSDGTCVDHCETDADCEIPGHPRCLDGVCTCSGDDDCAASGIPFASACSPTGACGCATDDECRAAGHGDTCLAGTCTCGARSRGARTTR